MTSHVTVTSDLSLFGKYGVIKEVIKIQQRVKA